MMAPAQSSGSFVATVLRQTGHSPLSYPAQRLHANGTLEHGSTLLRRALIEDLGLKPRDIVLLFSKDTRLSFDLNVRNASVLMSLGKDGPGVIVARRDAWVIPRGVRKKQTALSVQRRFLEVVSMARVANCTESTLFDRVPFALAVTEALLVMFLERLRTALQRATAEGAALLAAFASTSSAEISAFKLEVLRRTKQRLDYLRGQAKGLQQTLFEALSEEEEINDFSRAVGATAEEWELCFEYYSHGAEEVGLEAMTQLEGLEDLERSISLRLSSRRLELEKLQIYLDVLGNGLSLGAVLTGAFGMNLLSGIEERKRTFWPVFGGILLLSAATSGVLRYIVGRRLRRNGGTTAVWVTSSRRGGSSGAVSSGAVPGLMDHGMDHGLEPL